MTERLSDRPVAVVTGASSGFGEEIVHRLANKGWLTIGLARREDRLAALAAEVNGEYEACDLTDANQVANAASTILNLHPTINLLVNNAGMALRSRFKDADPDEVREVMNTNYEGPFRITEALLPGLKAANPSDVINIVSAAGAIANRSSGPYGASKHAQLALSRCTAVDYAEHGIRVHAILPGKADTEGHPQKPSNSPLSKLTRTDVEKVAKVTIDRVGRRPREVYVPRILHGVAVINNIAPVTTGRVVSKLIS